MHNYACMLYSYCVNILALMFITTAGPPTLFRRDYGHQLGLDYHLNQCAWMKRNLFYVPLLRLNQYVWPTVNWHIIFFENYYSANGDAKSLLEISNIEIYFQPFTKTSKIQPLHAEIIVRVDPKFKMHLFPYIFRTCMLKTIYSIDVAKAMRSVT